MRAWLTLGFVVVLFLAGCAALDPVMNGTEARSQVREGIARARKVALALPGISDSARTRIASSEPHIASFIDMGVLVECRYAWDVGDSRELVVRYRGSPLDAGNEATTTLHAVERSAD